MLRFWGPRSQRGLERGSVSGLGSVRKTRPSQTVHLIFRLYGKPLILSREQQRRWLSPSLVKAFALSSKPVTYPALPKAGFATMISRLLKHDEELLLWRRRLFSTGFLKETHYPNLKKVAITAGWRFDNDILPSRGGLFSVNGGGRSLRLVRLQIWFFELDFNDVPEILWRSSRSQYLSISPFSWLRRIYSFYYGLYCCVFWDLSLNGSDFPLFQPDYHDQFVRFLPFALTFWAKYQIGW